MDTKHWQETARATPPTMCVRETTEQPEGEPTNLLAWLEKPKKMVFRATRNCSPDRQKLSM